jgi:hypothetical protein
MDETRPRFSAVPQTRQHTPRIGGWNRLCEIPLQVGDELPWPAQLLDLFMVFSSRDVALVETGIRNSYDYMCMTLDDCLTGIPMSRDSASFDRVCVA